MVVTKIVQSKGVVKEKQMDWSRGGDQVQVQVQEGKQSNATGPVCNVKAQKGSGES